MKRLATLFIGLFLGMASVSEGHMDTLSPTIDEGTSTSLSMGFTNDVKKPVVPNSYSLYVDDESTSMRLYSYVQPSPTASVETFTLPPEAHRVIDESLEYESHIVTIIFKYTSSGAILERQRQWRIWIKNNAKTYVGPGNTPTGTPGTPVWGSTPFANFTPTPR